MKTSRVWIRQPVKSDWAMLLDLHRRSQNLHTPWAFPPLTEEGCKDYIERCQRANFEGFLICHRQNLDVIGVANLSQIFYGAFQTAYLGYYADVKWVRQGLMREGLSLVLKHAFGRLKLHRLEANIQPNNYTSIAFVKRLGFRKEGLSPRHLKLNDMWCDHERWALSIEDWRQDREQLRL